MRGNGAKNSPDCRYTWKQAFEKSVPSLYCRQYVSPPFSCLLLCMQNFFANYFCFYSADSDSDLERLLTLGDRGLWNLSSVFANFPSPVPMEWIRGGVVYHNKGTSEGMYDKFSLEQTETPFLSGELICGLTINSIQLRQQSSRQYQNGDEFVMEEICSVRPSTSSFFYQKNRIIIC